ncbi:MAG: serine/threonine-protein kinase [Myxococcota bacterium]
MFQAGQTVGGYELVRKVAAGGMATVFVARKDDTPFALKVIHQHLSQDWEAMRWFIDEALISIRLRHPNIVRVDELGEENGLYYLAMEYVHGCTLAELMVALAKRRRRLKPWLAAWIAREVAFALDAAHRLADEQGDPLGVIHRDVSPQNVMLGHDGAVKLTDFGIAQAGGRAERTRQGEIRGKIRYMAPEQVVGGQLDARLDVFALGVVLWEMLAQRRLYADLNTHELMEAVRSPEVKRPSSYRDDVPPQLEGIVLNSLAAERDARFQTAALFGELLDEARKDRLDDPKGALAELVKETLGPKLLAGAQALPPELAQSIGVDQLEPTIPRARRDETGEIDIDPALQPVPPPIDPSRPVAAVSPESAGVSWVWIAAVVFAIALLGAGVWWLGLD